jgi:hypothetical protein
MVDAAPYNCPHLHGVNYEPIFEGNSKYFGGESQELLAVISGKVVATIAAAGSGQEDHRTFFLRISPRNTDLGLSFLLLHFASDCLILPQRRCAASSPPQRS